jgi:hypothetical protein
LSITRVTAVATVIIVAIITFAAAKAIFLFITTSRVPTIHFPLAG